MDHAIKNLATELLARREEIVTEWLDRIAERVTLERDFVFPSDEMIDEMPLLVDGIARFLAEEEAQEIAAQAEVIDKARELGRLRFEQRFSTHQILWEYEVLGQLVLSLVASLVDGPSLPEPFVRRFHLALSRVQRASIDQFLELMEGQIHEREDRLRSFNRALTHELRNEVGAILAAGRMLEEDFVIEHDDQRRRFVEMVLANGERVEQLITNLVELSRLDLDPRQHKNVLLTHVVREVQRQLRGFARAHGVRIEVVEPIPDLEVNAAAVDLALTNLLANGIKYADPRRTDRWVRLRCGPAAGGLVEVEVTDNGVGIPAEERGRIFERYFRGRRTSAVQGTGLGLALVREAVERLGGTIAVRDEAAGGTTFTFTVRARRTGDGSADPLPALEP